MNQGHERSQEAYSSSGVRRAYRLIREFRKLHPEITCQLAESFLIVAMAETTTVSEVARKMGTSTAAASRHVAHLGTWDRKKSPGLGLVEMRETLADRRVKEVKLTSKGRMIAETLAEIVGD